MSVFNSGDEKINIILNGYVQYNAMRLNVFNENFKFINQKTI